MTGNPTAIKAANIQGRNLPVKMQSYLGNMARVNSSKRASVMKEYYKVLLVRDPLVRLISAYRDRVLNRVPFVRKIAKVIGHGASRRFART